jgi:hypothetical protein
MGDVLWTAGFSDVFLARGANSLTVSLLFSKLPDATKQESRKSRSASEHCTIRRGNQTFNGTMFRFNTTAPLKDLRNYALMQDPASWLRGWTLE